MVDKDEKDTGHERNPRRRLLPAKGGERVGEVIPEVTCSMSQWTGLKHVMNDR